MAVINVNDSQVKKKLFKLIVKVPVEGNTSTLTINLNSISISRVLRGSTIIYLRPTQVGEFLNQVKWFTICYNWCVLNGINARNLDLVGVVGQASLLGISAKTVGLLRNVLQREQQGSRQSRGL